MAKMKYWTGSAWATLDANNSDSVNNIRFRTNSGQLQYSIDGNTWLPIGSGGSAGIQVFANDSKWTGVTRKANTLTNDGQCIYANTSTSTNIVLATTIVNSVNLGDYTLMARLKVANKTIATDVIKLEVLKNSGGTFTSIASRNFPVNVFNVTTDFECLYLPFVYTGGLATNNELKVVITLLKTTSAFEIDLDYISIIPNVVGIVG